MPDNTDNNNRSSAASPSTVGGKSSKPEVHKIRRTDSDYGNKVVATFENEKLARRHVEQNFPRGKEVYLELSGGGKEFYSAEEDEPWATYEDED